MPIIVGHRGAAAHVLENTAASFAAAVRFGANMIEFDVHESLDGEFIVIHDTHSDAYRLVATWFARPIQRAASPLS